MWLYVIILLIIIHTINMKPRICIRSRLYQGKCVTSFLAETMTRKVNRYGENIEK